MEGPQAESLRASKALSSRPQFPLMSSAMVEVGSIHLRKLPSREARAVLLCNLGITLSSGSRFSWLNSGAHE